MHRAAHKLESKPLIIIYVNFDVGWDTIIIYYSLDTNFMMHSISFVCTECTCILIIAPASYEAVSGSQVQEASGRKTLPRQEETGTGSSNDL